MNKLIVVCLVGLVVGAIAAFAWRGGDALVGGIQLLCARLESSVFWLDIAMRLVKVPADEHLCTPPPLPIF